LPETLPNPRMPWNPRSAACAVLFIALAIAAPAETTFKTILNFNGTNGSAPPAALIQGLNGNLYGVTSFGGKNNAGTVFEVTTEGKLTILYNFCSKAKCADGEYPEASLVLATNGNFYGTTKFGGVSCSVSANGCGTIFEITPAGKLTTLYTFCEKGGDCSDGGNPQSPLIQDINGNLYGTAFDGGNANGAGTFFEITPEGKFTTLYSFCSQGGQNCSDGAYPEGAIAMDATGALYLTTTGGGELNSGDTESDPCSGIMLKGKFTGDVGVDIGIFLAFCLPSKGIGPVGGLTASASSSPAGATPDPGAATPDPDAAENLLLYGMTSGGGSHLFGVVYSATLEKKYSDLYNFCSKTGCADGAFPSAGLTEGTDGNFYGTTAGGGKGASVCVGLNGCGTVFMITPAGALTTLHQFAKTDGDDPRANLLQATNGIFYGVTFEDGPGGNGTIFSISTGLGEFVKTVPTIGAVASTVIILGTDLTGATAVTFNGKAADFKVVSATEITATVPTGATTGTVEVATPKATLKSFPFTIS
jgi:uncharacterized repeat protein (TIGR03803 family)